MKVIRQVFALAAFLAAAAIAPQLRAADNALPDLGPAAISRAAQAESALKKDAVCTRCHDETDSAPILSIYQTKHGVRGDVRTPKVSRQLRRTPAEAVKLTNPHVGEGMKL